jgi:hypothetical protein
MSDMENIDDMTREQLLGQIIYLQKKLSRLDEDRLNKIQNDINWIVQYLLKQDKSVQPPPFIPPRPPYYNPLYPSTMSAKPQCHKCGMQLDQVMGYVCGDTHCPTFMKATC